MCHQLRVAVLLQLGPTWTGSLIPVSRAVWASKRPSHRGLAFPHIPEALMRRMFCPSSAEGEVPLPQTEVSPPELLF